MTLLNHGVFEKDSKMKLNFNRSGRAALITACVLLLGACTFAGAAYQSAPKLALYELDGTLDLNAAQYELGAQRLESFYQWHRKSELPEFIAQLKLAARLAQTGAKPAQIGATMDWGLLAARRMALQALPAQLELLQSLTDNNVQALQKKQTKDNAKFRKEWGMGQSDALTIAQDKRFDTFVTWAQRIYGNLTTEQTRVLRAASDARVLRLDWALDERLLRQQTLLNLVRSAVDKKQSPAQLQAALADFVSKLDRASTLERQAYFDLSRAQTQQLIAQLSQLATPAQRDEAHKKLLGFVQDFQDIHNKP